MVPEAVNTESIGLRRNHLTMVKFERSSDGQFDTVAGHISLMCKSAEKRVMARWARWEEIKGV